MYNLCSDCKQGQGCLALFPGTGHRAASEMCTSLHLQDGTDGVSATQIRNSVVLGADPSLSCSHGALGEGGQRCLD